MRIFGINFKENDIIDENLWAAHYFNEGMFPLFRSLFGYLMKNEGGYQGALAWFEENADAVKHPCPPEGAAEVL